MAEFQLRCTRRELRDALAGVIPQWQTIPVIDALDALVASKADLDGRPRLHSGASEAQKQTVQEIATSISDMRRKALTLVSKHSKDGITCDELEALYGLAHSSISARLNWLERQGLVWRDMSDKRRTRAGGYANPYRMTVAGWDVLRGPRPGAWEASS